jgi:tRNA(Phe) wybutosine-synthesizing methylase Tyw3
MKTIIDASGCNTIHGEPELNVNGKLVVNGVNVMESLKHFVTIHQIIEYVKNMLTKFEFKVTPEIQKTLLNLINQEIKKLTVELKSENEGLKDTLKQITNDLKKLKKEPTT